MPKRPAGYRIAGLEFLGGKARRYRVVSTGETISNNAALKRIQNVTGSRASASAKFEQALVRTNDVERARREAGMSKRGLASYRTEITKRRPEVSPFRKVKGKWSFRGAQGWRRTFLAFNGREESGVFSGENLIALQDYRRTVDKGSQIELDDWLKAHPRGVRDDAGNWHFPETDLARIRAAKNRMTPRNRARFEREFHQSGEPDNLKAAA